MTVMLSTHIVAEVADVSEYLLLLAADLPPVLAATSDLAVIRLHGHSGA